jgi:hypothetical protein
MTHLVSSFLLYPKEKSENRWNPSLCLPNKYSKDIIEAIYIMHWNKELWRYICMETVSSNHDSGGIAMHGSSSVNLTF